MTSRLLPFVLGAAALATAAPTATAAKPKTPEHKYHYTFELEGRQTTTWTYNHAYDASLSCDAAQTGSGKETIRFAGKAKDVVSFDGMPDPIFVSKDGYGSEMGLRGTVKRSGSITTGATPHPEDCADGVGGPAPASDCGTKSIAGMRVEPTYRYRHATIVLNMKNAAKANFEDCPDYGSTFPNGLLDEYKNKRVGQQLPYKDLFEQGKNILIATGVDREEDGDAKWTTRIRWVLSIRRTKVEKLG